tara:strand:+ start:1319 stop:1774 length:456 start_codon:yes stop_codon:yes gene_type:complete
MKIYSLAFVAGLFFAVKSLALAPCPEGSSHLFDNCTGAHAYANGDTYVGEWEDGKKHGRGTYTWADGERYEGRWVSDTKSGVGAYFWNNGDRYEGEFVDGVYHGEGTFTYASGRSITGEWDAGKPWNAVALDSSGEETHGFTGGVPQCRKN